jgi:hypothetical protein
VFDGITALIAITAVMAAAATVAAIFVVGGGRGGELSTEHADHPRLALPARRPVAGTDAAMLRLPMGLWGYHQQVTDEAMWRFAQALTERDTRIAVLEQQLAEARKKLNARRAVTAPERPALPEGRSEWTGPDEQAAEPPGGGSKPPEDGQVFDSQTIWDDRA